jgi:hypothetical protein
MPKCTTFMKVTNQLNNSLELNLIFKIIYFFLQYLPTVE